MANIAKNSKNFEVLTLWSEYNDKSNLNGSLTRILVGKFSKKISLLKQKSNCYVTKISKPLTKEKIDKYIAELNLFMKKLALILSKALYVEIS